MWCDIWRIRNPSMRCFTFRQNHVSSIIERKLQESIIKTDILASFCTDHPSKCFSLQSKDIPTWGNIFWKFSNSLTSNAEYVAKMKKSIFWNSTNASPRPNNWEYLKYEVRKLPWIFQKILPKKRIKIKTFSKKN